MPALKPYKGFLKTIGNGLIKLRSVTSASKPLRFIVPAFAFGKLGPVETKLKAGHGEIERRVSNLNLKQVSITKNELYNEAALGRAEHGGYETRRENSLRAGVKGFLYLKIRRIQTSWIQEVVERICLGSTLFCVLRKIQHRMLCWIHPGGLEAWDLKLLCYATAKTI